MAEQHSLDAATLRHVAKLLEDRLQAVVTYGAGGCPTCHDAELRGAIATIKRLAEPTALEDQATRAVAGQRRGKRR
ncbi:MAG: hypothetical protein HY901_07825 [Deltaproteobacteria bacterium]|nr:hypothetical protein [Deltaproteobacteria bacterium]